jgi:hypothetical protein
LYPSLVTADYLDLPSLCCDASHPETPPDHLTTLRSPCAPFRSPHPNIHNTTTTTINNNNNNNNNNNKKKKKKYYNNIRLSRHDGNISILALS